MDPQKSSLLKVPDLHDYSVQLHFHCTGIAFKWYIPILQYYDTEFTLWDRFEIQGEMTMKELMDHFQVGWTFLLCAPWNGGKKLFTVTKTSLDLLVLRSILITTACKRPSISVGCVSAWYSDGRGLPAKHSFVAVGHKIISTGHSLPTAKGCALCTG